MQMSIIFIWIHFVSWASLGKWWSFSLLPLLLLSGFSRVWLCDPRDGSPAGFPIPGILQARTLEWVAISFSNALKWKVKVKLLSRSRLLATPMDCSLPGSSVHGFSKQEYWSGVPLPSSIHYYCFTNNHNSSDSSHLGEFQKLSSTF